MTEGTAEAGAATGGVNILLRLEGLTLFVGMVMLYWAWDGSWLVFALLFFVPEARTQFDVLSAGFARKGDVISLAMSEIGGFAIDQALTVKKAEPA